MKNFLAYIMGAFYVLAGINHFWHPDFYIKMIEGFLPYPSLLVIISGVAEVLLGLGMFFTGTRRWAAYGIIFLLIAVFPANISMAMHASNWHFSALALYIRLPLQFILVYWAYVYVKTKQPEA